MKTLILILAFFVPAGVYACFAPYGGPEYDKRIEITKGKSKNSYQVNIPKYIDDMPNEAEIILAYSKGDPGGIPIYEKYEVLKTTQDGNNLVADFNVEKREKKPYIVVMWWPKHSGMCGIQANTAFLEVD